MSRTNTAAAPRPDAAERVQAASPPLWRHLLWIVPACAGLAAYWGSLGNGFVWDDPLVLQQLRAIGGAGDLFVLPRGIPRLYYRPVVFATYLLDRGLGGEQPFWFHASVVAWHGLNTILVFFLARTLLRAARPAAPAPREPGLPLTDVFAGVAALLFAVHPAHVESVAWMAGRSDVIACAFLLGAFLLFLRRETYAPALAALSFLLALMTKEPVVLAVAVLPLAEWTLSRPFRLTRYAPFALAIAVYFALRAAGAGLVGEPTQPSEAGFGAALSAVGLYLGKAFLPLGQTVFYDAVPASPVYLIAGAIGVVALAALLLWGWRARDAAVVVSIAWFAATLAPALILVLRRISSTPVAERYVYIPSAGAAILVAYLLLRLVQRTGYLRLVLGMVALVGVAGAIEVARRNHVWENDVLFWTAAAAATTDAAPQRELGDALLRQGQLAAAEAAYLAAMQRPASAEERAMTFSNLGNLYSRGPRVDEAIKLFRQALALRQHPTFYHGLGLALMRKAQANQGSDPQGAMAGIVEARQSFERAIALGSMPNLPSAFNQWQPAKTHLLLGQVLVALQERDLARQHLELAVQLEPSGVTADTAKKFLAMVAAPAR